MICKDELNHLYRLCECRQALICPECFELCSDTIIKCPLCRKKLTFKKKRNWGKYCKLVLFQTGCYLSMLSLNLIYPILCLYNQNKLENILTFILSLLTHIFIEPINIYFIKKYVYLDFFYYYLLKNIATLIITFVLLITKIDYSYLNYIICIIVPFYVFPLIVSSVIINYNFLNKIVKYNNCETLEKKINFDIVYCRNAESMV